MKVVGDDKKNFLEDKLKVVGNDEIKIFENDVAVTKSAARPEPTQTAHTNYLGDTSDRG